MHALTQSLLTRKRQQLPHQICRAVGVLLDLHNIAKRRITRLMPQQEQITKSDNRGQQVIKVMRNPARQLPHSLHLLRLHELRLQRFFLRRIDEMQNNTFTFLETAGMKLR